jgi:hypothetical protein
MEVRELIEHLKLFPQDALIHLPKSDNSGAIKEIRMGRNKITKGKVCIFAGYSHQEVVVETPECVFNEESN